VSLAEASTLTKAFVDYIVEHEQVQGEIFGRTTGAAREGIYSDPARKAVRLNLRNYDVLLELVRKDAPDCEMAVTPGAIVTEHVEHHHNHAREKRPMPDQLEYAAQQPIIVMKGAQRRRVRSDLGSYFTRPFNKASKRGQYRDGAAGRKFRHFTSVGGLLPKYKRRRASMESVAVRRGVTMAVLKAEQAKLVDF
jgi:hypothetical protein